jgi:capsular polysaccharide transport system permease protein
MVSIGDNSFRRSLGIQIRVIWALLMREIITRYGRHNIGFMWMFVEPMMFTLGVATLWSVSKMGHTDMPIVAFAVTGYSSVLLWRNMGNRCASCIEPNLALMYHRNVKVIDIFASRLILEFSGATISFLILSIFFTFIGQMPLPEDILKVLLGWGMLTWFGCALALTVGSLSEISHVVEKIWHPLTYVMFPLSGAMFLVDWFPSDLQRIILYLPMVHGVELLREGYFGSTVHAHYDIPYMATICLCMSLVGLAVAAEVGRRVTPE